MVSPAIGWPFLGPSGPVNIRHGFIATFPFLSLCRRCGRSQSNRLHRVGSRCSVCFRYFKHYELDASRRCDACRP